MRGLTAVFREGYHRGHRRHTIRGYRIDGWMSLTAHLMSPNFVARAEDEIFLYGEEDLNRWRRLKTPMLRHRFLEDAFEKVSLSFFFIIIHYAYMW
jgi:hypothetical protein